MTERIAVFWVEPTEKSKHYLRRFHYRTDDDDCPAHGSHSSKVEIGEGSKNDPSFRVAADDPLRFDDRWPLRCDCGYQFKDDDPFQRFTDRLYRRVDTGEEFTLFEIPVGAMWDAHWYTRKGPDGLSLYVKTPGGDWFVDGRASNCTMPEDKEHRCWVRHGDPRDPQGNPPLHVDKAGLTCDAGAGSIGQDSYHGFLHNGHLGPA